MAGAFDRNTPGQGAAKELAKQELPMYGEGVTGERRAAALTARYMILQKLAESKEPMYALTISKELAQYGITKERILVELSKLSKGTLVSRETIDGAYGYRASEKGLNELKRILNKERETKAGQSLSESCNWLLENLQEPKSFDELSELFYDSDKTLSVLLSKLSRSGIIAKIKLPVTKKIVQRGRRGKLLSRITRVRKTFYVLNEKVGNAKPPQLEKEGHTEGIPEPVLTQQEKAEYLEWRRKLRRDRFEKFHRNVIANANRQGVAPETVYKTAFKRLVVNGIINVGHYYPADDKMEE